MLRLKLIPSSFWKRAFDSSRKILGYYKNVDEYEFLPFSRARLRDFAVSQGAIGCQLIPANYQYGVTIRHWKKLS